jgi:hypothetical protein
MASPSRDAALPERPGWVHSLQEGCRSVAQALGIRKLQEIMQVGAARSARTSRQAPRFPLITLRPAQGTTALSSDPVWLLGTLYGVKDSDSSSEWLAPEVGPACDAPCIQTTALP